jgi:hypothetical protein
MLRKTKVSNVSFEKYREDGVKGFYMQIFDVSKLKKNE